jgi:predicted polyphosphate/ATP-dependent NAD kinase
MKKEIVEIDERYGKEYAGKYVFQEITWAKRNRILQKYTKYNPQTGVVVTADYVAIQAETVYASLVEQPQNKPITLEKLLSEGEDGIPIALGELLSRIANKLSIVSVEETKNF